MCHNKLDEILGGGGRLFSCLLSDKIFSLINSKIENLKLYETTALPVVCISVLKDRRMKRKDVRELVLRLYNDGRNGSKTHKHVRGIVSKRTVYSWIKSIKTCGNIDLKSLTGRPRVIRTKALIHKVKQRLSQTKRVLSRSLARELHVSHTTMNRLIKEELGYKFYIKRISL